MGVALLLNLLQTQEMLTYEHCFNKNKHCLMKLVCLGLVFKTNFQLVNFSLKIASSVLWHKKDRV